MSISRFSLRDKVTLRLLKLYFYIADIVVWSRALYINGVSLNPVEGRTKICQLKDLILTLFGLISRRIYIYIYIYDRQAICKIYISFNFKPTILSCQYIFYK